MPLTRVKKVPTANLVQGSSFLTSVPTGSVVQVVGTTNDVDVSRTGSTTMTDSISQVITPSSASNKIMVVALSLIHI